MIRRVGTLGLWLMALGPLLGMTRVAPGMPALVVTGVGGLLSLAAFAAGVIALIRGQRRNAAEGLLLGLPAAALVVTWLLSRGGFPPINDVTTAVTDSPRFADNAPYPAHFVPHLQAAYDDLAPVTVAASMSAAYDAVLDEVASRSDDGWSIVRKERASGRVQGTAQSAVFGFIDDWVVQLRQRSDEAGVRIDVRSRSRDGVGDMGVNAARIRSLLDGIQARLDLAR